MKKIVSVLLAAVMIIGMTVIPASAAGTKVYVTIADQQGQIVLARKEVEVTDADNDGAITVNDALYAAHEANFEGGAAAGYLSETGQYGLSLKKLWGFDNGTGYGYYVNNASAMSLADPVTEGAHIYAFIYTDTTNWSDTYSFFENDTVEATAGGRVQVTLKKAGFDESYNQVNTPVEGAVIYVNGTATTAVTDAEGKATVTLANAGTAVISAKAENVRLVPPVCIAKVSEASVPVTGDAGNFVYPVLFAAVICAAYLAVSKRNKKENEA